MEDTTYVVSGSSVSDLNSSLYEAFRAQERHAGDGFAVLIVENYEFWRSNSNMQSTIIIDHRSSDTAHVKIVVGGGATGLLQITWGSENKILRKMKSRTEEIFSELELSVENSHIGGESQYDVENPQTRGESQYECEDCGVLFQSNRPRRSARCTVCGGSPSPEE